MSGKIDSDSPKSPQAPHKDRTIPSKVERSAIPPNLEQEKINVEKMSSSVRDDKKRKKKEFEEAEKELDPAHRVKKKRELDEPRKEKLEQLREQVFICFGPLPQNIDTLKSIAFFCFKKTETRIKQLKYLQTEEIKQIYKLLFETELQSIFQSILSEDLNPTCPSPVYVVKSLYDCIKILDPYQTFENAVLASKKYINSNNIRPFLDCDLETRESIIKYVLEKIPNYQELLDNCPLYNTRDLLKSQNIHDAFVLRNALHEPCWIFKPTASVKFDELLNFESDYTFTNSVRERLTTLLNFHNAFPIPSTYLLEINGTVGSVQLFLKGKKEEIDEYNEKQLSIAEMQSLLIFDLIFANCDRHMDNILPIKVGSILRVNGIDHEACFAFDNRPLKIDYLRYDRPFNCAFEKSLYYLVSEESAERYEEIMKDSGQDKQAIDWMLYATKQIRTTFNQGQTARHTARDLMDKFNRAHVTN